jgi:hypothetical protein
VSLTDNKLKSCVWYMILRQWVIRFWHFGALSCPHHQGSECLRWYFVGHFDGSDYALTQYHFPEEQNPQLCHCENPKTHMITKCFLLTVHISRV